MVESIVASEGGADDEPSYDGRKLAWTKDARAAVRGIDEAYLRRRTRARIEKSARLRKLKTVTLEFAQKLIEEETGMPLAGAPGNGAATAEPSVQLVSPESEASNGTGTLHGHHRL